MLRACGAAALILAGAGCADIIGLSDYSVESAGGGGTATTTSVSSSTATTGAGGEGGAPCVPVAETCNGLDDDCDGVADEPVSGEGDGCAGCIWTLFEGAHYALCPADGLPVPSEVCPLGTRPVVLQSMAEHDHITTWLPSGGRAFLGLYQAGPVTDLVAGWAWSREGMPYPWDSSQPGDEGSSAPDFVENGDEDCAHLLTDNSNPRRLHDAPCVGPSDTFFACEEIRDECIQGAECLRAKGCVGTFDCSLPEGARCVAKPGLEECNGADDDCNGEVDDDDACECSTFSGAGKTYKLCTEPTPLRETHCGEGFIPAMPKTSTQLSAILSGIQGFAGFVRIGVYQGPDATQLDQDWRYHDGDTFSDMLWDAGEPEENGAMMELHTEDCAIVRRVLPGVHDFYCSSDQAYLCEAL